MAKIVLKRKAVPPPSSSTLNSAGPVAFQLTGFKEFEDAVRINSDRNFMGILRDFYEKTFGVFPPWTEHPVELVRTKLTYELLKRDYEKAGVPMPANVKQNWEASRDFNISKMTTGMKGLVEANISAEEKTNARKSQRSQNEKEPVMATKSKAAESKKERICDTFIRLYRENSKEKRTDDQLAKEMQKCHPDSIKKYDGAYMNQVRGHYNRGVGPFAKAKPGTPAVGYDAKGVVLNGHGTNGKMKKAPVLAKKVVAMAKKKIILKKVPVAA